MKVVAVKCEVFLRHGQNAILPPQPQNTEDVATQNVQNRLMRVKSVQGTALLQFTTPITPSQAIKDLLCFLQMEFCGQTESQTLELSFLWRKRHRTSFRRRGV